MKEYFLERAQEASTWRAIIWCLSAFGVWAGSPDQKEAIIMLGMALAGGAGMLPDRLRRGPDAGRNV